LHYALSGRPGPVWLDVPLNVQGALIDETKLSGFNCPDSTVPAPTQKQMLELLAMLQNAKRPLFIAGHGIAISGAEERFRNLLDTLKIPAVTTFCSQELLNETDPLFAGRIGTIGQRAGNFILQNADLIISIGSRNNIRQVSYNWENFGCRAQKVSVDIDTEELKKKLLT
jgi:acetolactate synthase-1/2/3 large subunit